ncbi:hypothetical protein JWE36_20015, partial [Acinetobacter baumannii]|uniref:hypothetical protein n=1 Tax=Acinetobacter baumannii TaxID=470 RepID=UPI001C0F2DA0
FNECKGSMGRSVICIPKAKIKSKEFRLFQNNFLTHIKKAKTENTSTLAINLFDLLFFFKSQ